MSKMLQMGWDIRTPDAGTVKSQKCITCNCKMKVTRNVNGPTGWAEARSKIAHLHDRFECPHAGKSWHVQAIKLKQMIKDTPSRTITKMLEKELKLILKTKKPTLNKEFGIF